MLTQTLKKITKKLIIVFVWLGIWQILSAVVGLSVLLPSPVATAVELKNLAVTKDFWISVILSVCRISAGFAAGVVSGVIAGSFSAISKTVNEFLSPLVSIIKATPVASFIILAVIWFKTGNIPSFATALIVFPFVYSNIRTGIKETDRNLTEMASAFNVPFGRKLLRLYIPSVRPYFISASTTAIGLAWKAGIAAEVICNPTMSIGNGIYEAKVYFEPVSMFAWTTVVVILSIIIENLIKSVLKRGIKK